MWISTGRVEITGTPGVVVPHRANLRGYSTVDGMKFQSIREVVWPMWRRVAVKLGFWNFALKIGKSGSVSVVVRPLK